MNCSKSGKRIFESEQDALDFVAKSMAQYGMPQQFPYLCEECNKFHLTSQKPGDHGTTTNWENMADAAPARRKYTHYRPLTSEEKTQALNLNNKGVTAVELAKQFGTSYARVCQALKEAKFNPPPVTVDSLEAKAQALQAELERVKAEAEKQREAQRVKATRLDDGRIHIRQAAQALVLSEEDATTLVILLDDILTAKAA